MAAPPVPANLVQKQQSVIRVQTLDMGGERSYFPDLGSLGFPDAPLLHFYEVLSTGLLWEP